MHIGLGACSPPEAPMLASQGIDVRAEYELAVRAGGAMPANAFF